MSFSNRWICPSWEFKWLQQEPPVDEFDMRIRLDVTFPDYGLPSPEPGGATAVNRRYIERSITVVQLMNPGPRAVLGRLSFLDGDGASAVLYDGTEFKSLDVEVTIQPSAAIEYRAAVDVVPFVRVEARGSVVIEADGSLFIAAHQEASFEEALFSRAYAYALPIYEFPYLTVAPGRGGGPHL